MRQPLTNTLHEIVWLMDRRADTLLKQKVGISFSWFHLMIILLGAQPTTQHNLAVCLNYSDAAVSKLLEKLSKVGFVKIVVDPAHARKRIVTLSDKGEAITKSASRMLEAEFNAVVVGSGINLSEYTRMNDLLAKQLREYKDSK